MTQALEQILTAAWPPTDWSEVTVVVAVSGGADSMALLRCLHSVRIAGPGRLLVAHFNHRLRGAESDADARFVQEQSAHLGIDCLVGSADSANAPPRSEDAARDARYQFLSQTARAAGARFVATAHTADDQAETILHRILRGTGLPGLAGIRLRREWIPGIVLIRPLLPAWRRDVLAYLAERDQPFREDSTNADARYTRNQIRHVLIPSLERDYNPRVRESLIRLGQLAEEASSAMKDVVEALRVRVVECLTPTQVVIRCDALNQAADYLVSELLRDIWGVTHWPQRDMELQHWKQLVEFARATDSTTRHATLPGNIQATRDGPWLTLESEPTRADSSDD